MAWLIRLAAELYLVVLLLVTSLLADSSQNENDPMFTSSPPPEITPSNNLSDNAQTLPTLYHFSDNTDEDIGDDSLLMQSQTQLKLQDFDSNTIAVDVTTSRPTTTSTSTAASVTDVVRHHAQNRMYPLPHFRLSDLPDTRWGPFFEEGNEPHNITARVGSTVNLDCRIGLLQDKTVMWLHHKEDSIHLLTVGRQQYSSDDRIALNFRYPNNYRLKIAYVTRREEGLYECQVATHPPKVKRIFLKVTAPEVRITDESGRQVTERYYKAGSGLELACNARQVGAIVVAAATAAESPPTPTPVSWRHGDQLLTKGISTNVSASTDSASSTLTVAPLQKKHSGNYTCAVGTLAAATVAVHVLNGELPAAVHHGNAAGVGATSMQLILATACVTVWRLR